MLQFNRNFIAGRWSDADGTDQSILTNPATGLQSAIVQHSSRDDLNRAIDSASEALRAWRTATPEQRALILDRCMDELRSRSEQFISCMTAEIGIPGWIARRVLLPMPLQNGALAIETIRSMPWSEQIGSSLVTRAPVGVVGAITPWNAPLHPIVAKVIAGLAAGCTVVLKASEIAPTTAILFAESLHAAGVPAGVFNLVWGGAEIGEAICSHPGIDMVSFTGSERVGLAVAETAGRHGKRVVLELGGKSAALVCDDAPLDRAVPAILTSCFASSGQTCVAQSRMLIPEHLSGVIEDLCLKELDLWTVGDPLDETVRLGPVATRQQQQRIESDISAAVKAGARMVRSKINADLPAQGYFCAPTVLFDVTPDMRIAREEVFGPVLAVMTYRNDDDAVAIANDTAFGLSGSVWSEDTVRATQLARRMMTGQVSINGAPQNLHAPFGGFKRSGYGRENGRFGVEECLQYHVIHGAATVA